MSHTYLIFDFNMLDVINGRHTWIKLLSAYGYRVAKYVNTKMHTQKNKPKKSKEKERKETKGGREGRSKKINKHKKEKKKKKKEQLKRGNGRKRKTKGERKRGEDGI